MKSVLWAVVAGVLAMGCVAFAGQQDFTLVNDTGVEIQQIYISAASVDNWEEDLLGADGILPDGNEMEIKFSPDEEADLWDVRVVDSEGTAIVWERLKLTEITKLTLQIEDGEAVASIEGLPEAEASEQDFTLVNDTGVEIQQIYISAASVDNWEEDLLGSDEVLPAGNELAVHFAPEEDADLWDVRVVDSEGTAIVWERLKLTEISKVTLQIEDGEPVATLE